MKLRERIIALLQSEDYVPATKNGVAEALELAKRDRRKLDYELRQLLSKGEVIRFKGDRYCIPKDADLVTGSIRFRQSGSAIVIPDPERESREPQPIEVEASDTFVAMHGDQVVVRMHDANYKRPFKPGRRRQQRPNPADDKPSGKVIRIMKRAQETLVGNLQKTRLFHYVVPDDPRYVHDIYVPDPAESNLKPKPRVGSKVVVKLHEWSQPHVNPEGEIIQNLGLTHEPQAELAAILHKYDLDTKFPDAVLKEAKAIPSQVQPKQLKGRRDLRQTFTFTIDPDDAKDFDDAITVEQADDTHIRIGIHIADVGAYVRPGSLMDKEAQRRGNSTYLVGIVIPMLPRELSNGICSLVEDEDRLTKSVFITFSKKGVIRDIDFANTVIRSNKRLTYKQAYTLLAEDDIETARQLALPPAHQTGSTGRPLSSLDDAELGRLQDDIRKAWSVASKLRKARFKKGSLNLEMEETKIFVDEDGYADRLEKVEHDESHQLIEEFMLAANEAVAYELKNASLPCIYRVHEQPDEERLQELSEHLATFGVLVGDLLIRDEMVKLLKTLDSHPQGHILKTQVLRSLKKACYRSNPDGHYGLAKENYCHFTSPIRRYSDLVVHRIYDTFLVKHRSEPPLDQKNARYDAAKAASMGEHLSLTEVNSANAERESIKVKQLEFFERELDKKKQTRFQAVITETRNHGMFIELVESNAFGMVHVSTLKDDLYRLSPDGTALVGRKHKRRFKVGQKIQVVAHRVDRFKRQVDFRIT